MAWKGRIQGVDGTAVGQFIGYCTVAGLVRCRDKECLAYKRGGVRFGGSRDPKGSPTGRVPGYFEYKSIYN